MIQRVGMAIVLATMAIGCARPLTCPAAGGPPWVELESPHFLLRTDLDEVEAKATIVQFERIYRAFERVAFPHEPKPSGLTHVVVFGDEDAFARIGPRGSGGYLSHRGNDMEHVPTLVFPGGLSDVVREVFQHELSHRFFAYYFPSAPVWLNEGVAEFYSTLRLEEGSVVLGKQLSDRLITTGSQWFSLRIDGRSVVGVPKAALPRVPTLLSLDPAGFYVRDVEDPTSREARMRRSANYTAAWALVHALQIEEDGLHPGFLRYLRALSDARDTRDRALVDAFGDAPERALERALARFVETNEVEVQTVRRAYVDRAPAILPRMRGMRDEDVHALWARLRTWSDPSAARAAAADLDEAVRVGHDRPEPYLARGTFRWDRGDLAGARSDLERAASLAPDEPRYLYPLASFYTRAEASLPPEQRVWDDIEPLVARLEPRATSQMQLDYLARYHALRRRFGRALAYVKRAVDGNASCSRCYETLADILFQQGKAADAVRAQHIAINILGDDQVSDASLRRLWQYKKALEQAEMAAGEE
ncbi:hypothetical protein WMF30_55805 [Sorangium sp. So ce134]